MEWAPTGIPMPVFTRQTLGKSLAEVEQMYGRGFLVGGGPTSSGPRVPAPTSPASPFGENTADVQIYVFPLRRQPTSTHPFVSIGRLEGNDIVIPRESISKFHAYVKEVDGAFFIQDARSRNGTRVNGADVPRRGEGQPIELKDNSLVLFGGVDVTFHAVKSMVGLTKGVFRLPRA